MPCCGSCLLSASEAAESQRAVLLQPPHRITLQQESGTVRLDSEAVDDPQCDDMQDRRSYQLHLIRSDCAQEPRSFDVDYVYTPNDTNEKVAHHTS
jgi:hypothetical protein